MPDLTTIPGLTQLWTHTTGDPRIKIAVLDGQADMDRACFRGANFSQLHPYWQEDPEPIPPAAVEQYWELEALQKKLADLKKDEDETAAKDAEIQALEAEIDTFKETIPAPIRNRLGCNFHATHISSTIFGQPNSPVEGIAPHCTGINIPITISGEEGEFISPPQPRPRLQPRPRTRGKHHPLRRLPPHQNRLCPSSASRNRRG